MEDISLHILDIAENSVHANAKRIEIVIAVDEKNDLLRIEINDDGSGMDHRTLGQARDPFFSSKNKKTGLGLPFLAQAAEQTGGSMAIDTSQGKGTRVTATFRWSHIDRPALGSMAETLMILIAGHPEMDFLYEYRRGGDVVKLDTEEIKRELAGVPINAPQVLEAIRAMLK